MAQQNLTLNDAGNNAPTDAQDLLTDITGHENYEGFAYGFSAR